MPAVQPPTPIKRNKPKETSNKLRSGDKVDTTIPATEEGPLIAPPDGP